MRELQRREGGEMRLSVPNTRVQGRGQVTRERYGKGARPRRNALAQVHGHEGAVVSLQGHMGAVCNKCKVTRAV
eukprot:1391516-Rhodomonas_salina.1